MRSNCDRTNYPRHITSYLSFRCRLNDTWAALMHSFVFVFFLSFSISLMSKQPAQQQVGGGLYYVSVALLNITCTGLYYALGVCRSPIKMMNHTIYFMCNQINSPGWENITQYTYKPNNLPLAKAINNQQQQPNLSSKTSLMMRIGLFWRLVSSVISSLQQQPHTNYISHYLLL